MTLLPEFEGLLKQAMGLDAASIGSSSVERAVQERLSACKLDDARAYLELVRSSPSELQALIEAVVVPETWFFRDREAFVAVARITREEWLPAHPSGVLRLLSLPCSTGEEPYSMAMALLDAGVAPHRFRVDAVDISALALERAVRAIYGRNSFRGQDLAFRERYFECTSNGHSVNEAVRRQVNFQQGNLFDPGFLPGTGAFDIVFCRNVLIYFDRATQDRAVRVLERLLAAQGTLFVGPSETALLLGHAFTSTKIPLAFAFRKATTAPARVKPTTTRPRMSSSPRAKTRANARPKSARLPSLKPTRMPSKKPAAPRRSGRPPAGLEQAAELANEGKLALAAKICHAHVAAHGPSAPALHLLGVISDASGDATGAADYYRKALYLDPQHHEALLHLALLLDGRGDVAGAKAMRGRAERAAQKSRK